MNRFIKFFICIVMIFMMSICNVYADEVDLNDNDDNTLTYDECISKYNNKIVEEYTNIPNTGKYTSYIFEVVSVK